MSNQQVDNYSAIENDFLKVFFDEHDILLTWSPAAKLYSKMTSRVKQAAILEKLPPDDFSYRLRLALTVTSEILLALKANSNDIGNDVIWFHPKLNMQDRPREWTGPYPIW